MTGLTAFGGLRRLGVIGSALVLLAAALAGCVSDQPDTANTVCNFDGASKVTKLPAAPAAPKDKMQLWTSGKTTLRGANVFQGVENIDSPGEGSARSATPTSTSCP